MLSGHLSGRPAESVAWLEVPRPPKDEEAGADTSAEIDAWLERVLGDEVAPAWLKEAAGHLHREFQRRKGPVVQSVGGSWMVTARRKAAQADETTTEGETSSFTGVVVPLREHLAGVGEIAQELGRRCALPGEIVEDLRLAGEWHDAGKVDPRFQIWLHGGSRYRAEIAAEPLAKSSVRSNDRSARLEALKRSGYPNGARHELSSLALMEKASSIRAQAHDWELVQYLVSAHHGHCRPLAPYVADESPVELAFSNGTETVRASSAHGFERLDSGVSDRFWRLVRRYGWFGLAWLECIFRLADHRRSEEEQHRSEEAQA